MAKLLCDFCNGEFSISHDIYTFCGEVHNEKTPYVVTVTNYDGRAFTKHICPDCLIVLDSLIGDTRK